MQMGLMKDDVSGCLVDSCPPEKAVGEDHFVAPLTRLLALRVLCRGSYPRLPLMRNPNSSSTSQLK